MSLNPRSALRRLINFGYLPSLRLSYSTSSRWKPSVCSIHLPVLPRRLHHSSPDTPIPDIPERICPKLDPTSLPLSCPGCGAFTQWLTPEEAGYYSVNRKSVKEYIRRFSSDSEKSPSAAEGVQNRNSNVDSVNSAPAEIKLGVESTPQPKDTPSLGDIKVPFCDRCHGLINHGIASPIPYPPISYIEDILVESPYRHNHVYHIIDAADFPMSLIPNISRILDLAKPRTQNRRAKTIQYGGGGRKPVLSFIITRSDLLGSRKEFVDHLMTYVLNVMREALGSKGEKVRLGNVHMVSAHRGWWTKEIKDKIWEEGGGVWMVGKTNVGKSSLLQAVFPKSPRALPPYKLRGSGRFEESLQANDRISNSTDATLDYRDLPLPGELKDPDPNQNGETNGEVDALLPPAQQVAQYPIFPIVSSLPGTTASPIRIPFGRKRGEVIDLPGLARAGLEEFVKDDHKSDLIMKKRLKPERLTLKPKQSLVLGGGLIRITPVDADNFVVLAAPFVPIQPHVTSTEKAILMQAEQRKVPNVPTIAREGFAESIKSAGIFEIDGDVTKTYGKPTSLPLDRKQKKMMSTLPYQVLSTDILIEGCGWVELVVQVRAKDLEAGLTPKVEVFSPAGKFVARRRPMCAYSLLLEKQQSVARKRVKRPMSSVRRRKGGG
ncbi:conserved hypothetical protein [Histoplasma capsulatum G186AR]|uniref:G domain-containing protein n=2 Tax=Ajellomyces capsulatus TaxID=5037 RepID=C0NH94_AJECG|nr:uncharacterized protein HCBG_02716 [Histoplasma capsulatum G186AR]EEH09179.1 conserved hypothetical protein [Histoplasma capsulatum G186AR]KAG5303491.1 ribosome biogenesis GTPase YqeH superfamily domain-containing protein [Histoplasma capsulatum]QSS69088.1 ribosome biogenesis GTPase YqeH superfamily domain-containing protein [Histoplasma capsulatum G186AR]